MRKTILFYLMAVVALATSFSAQAQNGPGYITDGTLNMPTTNLGATFTFTANAGQYIAVAIQEQDSNVSSVRIQVLSPTFSPLYDQTYTAPPGGGMGAIGCAIPGGTAGCWGNIVANFGPVTAGTYLVVVTPLVGNGEMKFTVTSPLISSGLVVNGGNAARSTVYPGQSILMPVSLLAGQNYTLTVSETNGYSPGNQGKVLHPNGNVIGTFFQVASCTNPCGLGQYSGSGWVAFTAPVNGTYNFLLQQLTQTSGPNIYGPIWNTSTFNLTSP